MSAGRVHLVAQEPHRRVELRGVPRERLAAAAAAGAAPAGASVQPDAGGATGSCAAHISASADGPAGRRYPLRRPHGKLCLRSAADCRAARRRAADWNADDRRSAGANCGSAPDRKDTVSKAHGQAGKSTVGGPGRGTSQQQRRQPSGDAGQKGYRGTGPSQSSTS